MRKVHVDVKQFSVPVPRVGSIETHSGYGASPVSGQEIHVRVQRERMREYEGYEAEKRLAYIFEKGPYQFSISGRADGCVEDPALIEEIKSAFDVEELYAKLLKEPNHPYVWQLRTYGYFFFKETGKVPRLNLHLVSSRNFRSKDININLDIEGYEAWLELRLEELVAETKIKEKLFDRRQKISKEMTFPFAAPRRGQKELVETVAENFEEGRALLVQAPTGLGKTAGILYPALKESLARGQKVVYVTPKNSQHQVAEEAVEKIQEQGCKVRSLTITAKSKMCLKAEPLCNPKYCEFAKDYYKKIYDNDLVNKLAKLRGITSSKLKTMGEEYEVCPFELSVEAIERADVVIGDYNYVFAPRGLLGRLSAPLLENEKANLVIDEAHNLPSRSQDYFSPSLSLQQLGQLERDFIRVPATFSIQGNALVHRARRLIQSYGKDGINRRVEIDLDPFMELDKDIRDLTMEYLDSDVEIMPQDPVLRFTNMWSDFVNSITLSGEEFFQTYQKNNFTEMLKITCCDASEHLKLAYKEFKNVVAFSATLKPFNYYQELLGLSNLDTKQVEFQSPFEKHNRKLLIIPQISTKFTDRQMNAGKIADTINKITQVKPGNYIALFPSFEFMRLVESKVRLTGYKVLVQEREMKQQQTQSYLEEMKLANNPTLLLGVQGGVFSEGVDFPGDMLIGAFVVGPALPNFDFEREQIRNYYENRYGKDKAFNYAYVYPAMAKAIQSAGRVIRSESDRGVIVMLDSRFLQNAYAETMPDGWYDQSPQELVSSQILADVKNFWENTP
ncbi:ATP-dependent DNA helicase [Bdellovibrio reynosensis]|uniref:ATP-dependent DNA helicase n=1 Tax=Bdellovibrio reynosensis TaxID=2835041 RepID=A0ABY4C4J3_9BACT|nr:ATP-dependent DNA helicase [Bdellovibrio reynosensis]UOE99777.1 ATP-dependent DNA helicase [Bdellovibrio reynosensis]